VACGWIVDGAVALMGLVHAYRAMVLLDARVVEQFENWLNVQYSAWGQLDVAVTFSHNLF